MVDPISKKIVIADDEQESFPMQASILTKIYSTLTDWRKQYSRQEYPYIVIKKLFYDFYTDQELWPVIVNIVENRNGLNPEFDESVHDYIDAVNYVLEMRKKLKVEKILPKLDILIADDVPVVTNMRFPDHFKVIENAAKGNDSDLEKIEYHYIYYKMLSDLISCWVAAGIYTKKWGSAMFFATGMQVGGEISTFEDLFKKLHWITGFYLSGGTPDGSKMFGKYKALPPFE